MSNLHIDLDWIGLKVGGVDNAHTIFVDGVSEFEGDDAA